MLCTGHADAHSKGKGLRYETMMNRRFLKLHLEASIGQKPEPEPLFLPG